MFEKIAATGAKGEKKRRRSSEQFDRLEVDGHPHQGGVGAATPLLREPPRLVLVGLPLGEGGGDRRQSEGVGQTKTAGQPLVVIEIFIGVAKGIAGDEQQAELLDIH